MSRTFVTCSFPGPLTDSLAPKVDPLGACCGLVATGFVTHDFRSPVRFAGGQPWGALPLSTAALSRSHGLAGCLTAARA